MGFVKIQPAAKVSAGSFKVSTVQRGRADRARWRLQISIPSAEFGVKFGAAEQFDVLLGDGPDLGKMMIRPDEGGAFKPTFLKHCVLFLLPPSETTPELQFHGEDPVRRMAGNAMLVDLPTWAWEPGRWQAIRDARSVARRQDEAEKLTRREVLDRVGRVKP
ncbi:hypothetical protein [Rhizobium sp. AAP43]|uniref:hypothetical protein n=1 Tax=Rhizobium sp. AAP43 TaxID=1523420 RepID=UPI0006B94417|nr:hypothetical protein [Rhizobium sp. AAP43]KPF47085.1 hypothetical protein IP76_01955 [Rhizobium sp. AAP43]